ncbi:MAG: OB-fold nucleic acid binding domain-containing protein, partial [Betaproteobacteria bacterium]
AGIGLTPAPIFERSITPYEQIPLPVPSKGEDVIADYRSLGLTLGDHPLLLIRKNLNQRNLLTAKQLRLAANGSLVRTAGIVTCRQRPGTASGVVFVTLEDETGYSNIVIWRTTAESQRKTLINSQLLGVFGHIERDGEVVNLIAKKLIDYSSLFSNLTTRSRDFH